MKNGTAYAKRLAQYCRRLRRSAAPELEWTPTDPVEQLVLAHLSWDASPTSVRKAWREIGEQMIDLNEVRVSTTREVAAVVRDCVPNSMECARSISRSLNAIYRRENKVSLDLLKEKGRREARQYLESLEGVNAHAAASVLLWSLGAHAVPVNLRLLRALRKEGLVDPGADAAEVQAFLERHVAAAEGKRFCQIMEKVVAQKGGRPTSAKTGKKTGSKPKAQKTGSVATRRKKKPAGR